MSHVLPRIGANNYYFITLSSGTNLVGRVGQATVTDSKTTTTYLHKEKNENYLYM